MVLAIAIGTFFGKFFLIKIYPLLMGLLLTKNQEFPINKENLREQIIASAEEVGYSNAANKIVIYSSRGGDLHSNASVNGQEIKLSIELFKHHDGFEEEILAIFYHELGHWLNGDIYVTIAVDIVYMAFLAFFFKMCLNNPVFLTQFGFKTESLFISIYLFYKVYSVSIDYPLRKMYMPLYRFYETRADEFAIQNNHGKALRSGLLRNYSENNDPLFVDHFYAQMTKTHPTLLERCEHLSDFKQDSFARNETEEEKTNYGTISEKMGQALKKRFEEQWTLMNAVDSIGKSRHEIE